MKSHKIIKFLCKEYDIDLTDFTKEESDEKIIYIFNEIFKRDFYNFKQRVRFVKYNNNNNNIHIYITKIKVSDVFRHAIIQEEKKVYIKDKNIKIPYDEVIDKINRSVKLKKIKKKINI